MLSFSGSLRASGFDLTNTGSVVAMSSARKMMEQFFAKAIAQSIRGVEEDGVEVEILVGKEDE